MNAINYERIFGDAVTSVKDEGRYRIFANLERLAGEYPFARNHGTGPERVVVWCSNDYLGQGQSPVVLDALVDAACRKGAGSGGTRNISGTHNLHLELEQARWPSRVVAAAEDKSDTHGELVQARARAQAARPYPTSEELQAAGYESLRAIATGLEERGIPAAPRGKWSATQVMRLLGPTALSRA